MITYRNASRDELSTILAWAEQEGWNPGVEDAEAFWQADPEGFFVACDNETIVAAISVVNHTETFAFLGLYIAAPNYRGKGIGYALWQHALAHAGDRTVGLDGVPEQQANYAASGFALTSATTRYTGAIAGIKAPNVQLANETQGPTLILMEGAASGVEKPSYMRAWFSQTDTRKTLVLTQDNDITGFCTVRACEEGAKIGPLLAMSAKDAATLIAHAASLAGPQITIDVPDASARLKELCSDLSLAPGFTTARMYRGPFNPKPNDYFAITTMELG